MGLFHSCVKKKESRITNDFVVRLFAISSLQPYTIPTEHTTYIFSIYLTYTSMRFYISLLISNFQFICLLCALRDSCFSTVYDSDGELSKITIFICKYTYLNKTEPTAPHYKYFMLYVSSMSYLQKIIWNTFYPSPEWKGLSVSGSKINRINR